MDSGGDQQAGGPGHAPLRERCPACGAGLRPGADWCSLCYLDLRPQPVAGTALSDEVDPLTAPLLDVVLPPSAVSPVEAAPAAPVVPAAPLLLGDDPLAPARQEVTWPCTQCGDVNPLSAAVCSTCGSPFLAAAQDGGRVVLPLVGDLQAMSRARRLGLAALVVLVLLVPVALVTALTTKAPPASTTDQVTTTTTGPAGTGP